MWNHFCRLNYSVYIYIHIFFLIYFDDISMYTCIYIQVTPSILRYCESCRDAYLISCAAQVDPRGPTLRVSRRLHAIFLCTVPGAEDRLLIYTHTSIYVYIYILIQIHVFVYCYCMSSAAENDCLAPPSLRRRIYVWAHAVMWSCKCVNIEQVMEVVHVQANVFSADARKRERETLWAPNFFGPHGYFFDPNPA